MAITASSSNTGASPLGGAVTVGTVAQLAVPPNPSRTAMWLFNNSAAAIISVCPAQQYTVASGTAAAAAGANSVAAGAVGAIQQGVPVQNGAGSITIQPGTSVLIDTMNVGGAWNGISSAPGGALTVLEG